MKRVMLFVSLAGLVAVGCNKDKNPKRSEVPAVPAPVAKPAAPTPTATAGSAAGKVLETMNSGGYTYVKVNSGGVDVWAAGPEVVVAVGEEVNFSGGAPMTNYHSNTLDRTFEQIFFVSAINKGGAQPGAGVAGAADPHAGAGAADPHAGAGAADPHGAPGVAPQKVEKVAKAEGGQTVAEVFAGKGKLSGKAIVVRGKVVKFNGGILGRNWIHLQDGTGEAGTNDLMFTSAETVAVGDTVVMKGTLALDKDFGAGYKYEVIVEDATVVK